MHSGLLILFWLAGVASLQFVSPFWLLIATSLCGATAALFASARCWRLIRRIRFLLLAIIVLFAGFTPGEAVLIDWPRVSPSREGLALAAEHVGRVLAVVFCVALLMQWLSPQRLVGAIHALLRPLEWFNFPVGRIAVRTLLVLRLVESDTPRHWKVWIEDGHDDRHDPITVVRERFTGVDFAVSGATLAGLLAFLLVR